MKRIQVGDPVEFTREHIANYTVGDGEYGIAIENERSDGSVMVELADGSTYLAKHIHAFAWSGWLPDDLEAVYNKYNDDFDY